MKQSASLSILGLVGFLLLSCEDAKEGSDEGSKKKSGLTDKQKLQGTWKMVSGERGGAPIEDLEKCSLVFDGSKTVYNFSGVAMNGIARMDHGSVPKIFDLQLTAPGQPEDKGPISKGIYELEGDTLKWCNAAPEVSERPKEFSGTKENNHMVAIFKRVKE